MTPINIRTALIVCAVAFAVTAAIGPAVIRYLRKMKFGQKILEIGPKWHMNKQNIPTMGGFMFIIGIAAAVIAGSAALGAMTHEVIVSSFAVLGLWMVIDSIYMLIPVAVTFCFGLIVSVIISLMYSQSYFVMLDFPDFTALQCLRFSRRIMKGSKARRFYLDMSFIPLYLLGLLTCCIGLLFVIPYMNTTYSNFYLELMSKRNGQ